MNNIQHIYKVLSINLRVYTGCICHPFTVSDTVPHLHVSPAYVLSLVWRHLLGKLRLCIVYNMYIHNEYIWVSWRQDKVGYMSQTHSKLHLNGCLMSLLLSMSSELTQSTQAPSSKINVCACVSE